MRALSAAPAIQEASWGALALASWPLWFGLAVVVTLGLLGTPRGDSRER